MREAKLGQWFSKPPGPAYCQCFGGGHDPCLILSHLAHYAAFRKGYYVGVLLRLHCACNGRRKACGTPGAPRHMRFAYEVWTLHLDSCACEKAS
jgi:hypothetical protein